jgi:hypothetical protein
MKRRLAMMARYPIVSAALVLVFPALALADAVKLNNGQVLEGIITHEAGSQIRMQIAWTGYVTLTRDSIVEITRHDHARNRATLTQWRDEYHTSLERDAERKSADQMMREEGWIRFEGNWVRPEELAMIQEDRARREELRRDEARRQEDLEALTKRIEALEAENEQLRMEVLRSRNSLVVVQPGSGWNFPGKGLFGGRGRTFKDERGSDVRVHLRRGESFFMRDGQRIPVQKHGDHFRHAPPHPHRAPPHDGGRGPPHRGVFGLSPVGGPTPGLFGWEPR